MNRINTLWIVAAAALCPLENGFAEHHRASISVEDYRLAEVKIRKMIESGEVSIDRAEQRLKRMRLMIDDEKNGKTNRSAEKRRSFTEEEYRRAELKIRKMIEKGEVSKERAEQRLIRMRQMISSEKSAVPAS